MFRILLLVALLFLCIHAQNVTHGCIDSSTSDYPVEGNYSWYIDWDSHSIWIQQTEGETYIIYFDDNLGNMYQAFGLYKCDTMELYTEQVEEMNEKSPAVLVGCQGAPVLFCPALDGDDAMTLAYDGMNAADGSLDWIPDEYEHFYQCPYWFDYDADMNYPTMATMSFLKNEYCASTDNGFDNGVGSDVVAGSGQKTQTGTDSESERTVSDTTQAILWSLLGVLMLVCLVLAGYFIHKWMHRHIEQVHVGLTNKDIELEREDPTLQKTTFETLDVDQVPIAAAEDGTGVDGNETQQEVNV